MLLTVLGLYVAVLRDLPAFRVETVTLSGASSGYGPRLETELERAARGMTTLHVDTDRLSEIAERYPAVVEVSTETDFPHGLTVQVRERPPVGLVEARRGRRVPVAADGTLLDGQPVDRPLPMLPGRASSGRRARRTSTAAAARLTAAAPKALAASLRRVRVGQGGWTVELREGPELRFGSPADISAKWSAAAAVLRTGAARGARYVDLRMPDRPAAGGFLPTATSTTDSDANPVTEGDQRAGTESQSELETPRQP